MLTKLGGIHFFKFYNFVPKDIYIVEYEAFKNDQSIKHFYQVITIVCFDKQNHYMI